MKYDVNPFQELYLSEGLEDEFVELFSTVPLQSAINPVFQGGHVVLTGTQGCGKTMILRLLLPETRIAYHKANKPFPLATNLCQFISAGVNLTKSGLCDIAQVTLEKGEAHDLIHLPFLFADFFNHWVVLDLLRNVRMVAARTDVFGEICDLKKQEKVFVHYLVRQDCWHGTLDGCQSILDLEERVGRRVAIYRQWGSLNELDDDARQQLVTVRTSLGEPIARTVECLKSSRVMSEKTRVLIRIDQLEELHQAATPYQSQLRLEIRKMINRAIAARDGRIHYRIGTRRYGWDRPGFMDVPGSGARLENRRDYLLIDMEEELFTRTENVRGVFSRFAENAFQLRIKYSFKDEFASTERLARSAFGKSPKADELANRIAGPSKEAARVEQILALDDPPAEKERWSAEWRTWLRTLYAECPLDAVLAAAWGRQTGGQGKRQHRDSPPPSDNRWMKPWWRKERLEQAVLQLAARRAQRMLWWGYDDMIALSGGNITVFLHLCHKVWDVFLKRECLNPPEKRANPLAGQTAIPENLQAAGIQSASADWYKKLGEQPGGDVRRRFIEQLGKCLRQQLREDRRMSYPGANGFSLARDELEADRSPNREVWRFICDAVGYGDLHAVAHTTKNKAGEARIKFYLNPILSPAFQLPAAHTKEPLYWRISDVMVLARKAELPFALQGPVLREAANQTEKIAMAENPSQLKLFGD